LWYNIRRGFESRPFGHAAPVALPGAGAFLFGLFPARKKIKNFLFLLLTQYAECDMLWADFEGHQAGATATRKIERKTKKPKGRKP